MTTTRFEDSLLQVVVGAENPCLIAIFMARVAIRRALTAQNKAISPKTSAAITKIQSTVVIVASLKHSRASAGCRRDKQEIGSHKRAIPPRKAVARLLAGRAR